MIHCELCAYDERLWFRYATVDLFREHLELGTWDRARPGRSQPQGGD